VNTIGTTEHSLADKTVTGQASANTHLKEKKAGDLQSDNAGLLQTPESDDEGFIPVNSKKSKKNKNNSSSPTPNHPRNQQGQREQDQKPISDTHFTNKSTKGMHLYVAVEFFRSTTTFLSFIQCINVTLL
jgi:hypothetical protein